MKRTHLLIISLVILTFAFLTPLLAQDESQPDKDWLLFADEMDLFLELSSRHKNTAIDLSQRESEKLVEEAEQVAKRLASIYFDHLEERVKPELDAYLAFQIENNEDLENYFILLGNSFLVVAQKLLEKKKQEDRQIQRWATIGGTVLGFASGGALIYFNENISKQALKATVLVMGLGAVGAGLGFGGGYIATTFVLEAKPAIKNAKDFVTRFPAGEDFIGSIESPRDDLEMSLFDLEGDNEE